MVEERGRRVGSGGCTGDGVHELDRARPPRLVREHGDPLLVHKPGDLVRERTLHEWAHRVRETIHGLHLLSKIKYLAIQVRDRLGIDVEHDGFRDKHRRHVAAQSVLALQHVKQRGGLAVVQVEADPRWQPHFRVDLIPVALLHDALGLDGVGQINLKEAEALALVPNRARVKPRSENDDLAVLAPAQAGDERKASTALV